MHDESVSVTSHQGDDFSWSMAFGRPHPGLQGIVDGPYCGYVEHARQPFRRRQVANGRVTVIVSFGAPIDLVAMPGADAHGRRMTSFVAGLHDGYAVTEHQGAQHGLEVGLTPLGAARVLGAPHLLARECVALDDLLGRTADTLTDRLASAPDWPRRFALMDRFLLGQAADSPAPDRAVAWAWDQLERSDGRVPVSVLADEIGWSRRHFGIRFRDHVGLAPKPTARVLRFRRVTGLLMAGPVRSIADVAAACGYADHSHLIREFRVLGGCTPSQFVQDLLPPGGGVSG